MKNRAGQGPRRLPRGDPARADNVNAHISSGTAWLLKKQFDKAIAELNEAIRLDPQDAMALRQSRDGAGW